jgi:hypothetical protein
MFTHRLALPALLLCVLTPGLAQQEVSFHSPGLPPTRMDAEGRLLEDWGALQIILLGEDIPATGETRVEAFILEDLIPAARARMERGPVTLTLTAFRGPAWPGGVDVVTARVEETAGVERTVTLRVGLSAGARVGARTVALGGRTILTLPAEFSARRQEREWGYHDDAIAMPGWARPEGECDPAFRSIRAGMGGVPILYCFTIAPKSEANVVLGLCESHWAQPGQRPIICMVEGAPKQDVDPLARWGQHRPGALLFSGRDENGDGKLEVSVLPSPAAPDQNPILNVIWVFPAGPPLNLEQVIAGRLNALALYYVDVGGEKDQSLYRDGALEIPVKLRARGAQEITLFVACPGGAALLPDRTTWTAESLRRAARAVWKEWRER